MISAEMVKALREKTGLPMMDCKKALSESGGDEAKAIDWLRKQGAGRAVKMAEREAAEGRIACYVDPSGRAGIVELRCETAPVANTDDFAGLANLIARAAATQDTPTPDGVRALPTPGKAGRTIADEVADVFNRLRENIVIKRVASMNGVIGSYVHHNAQVGVLVEFSGPCTTEMRTDVCMHVAAMRPSATRREEADPAEVAREREQAAEAAKGKPPPIVEKMVAGKLDRWYSEFVLLEQPFVKDDKRSVGAVLSGAAPGLTVKRFLRYEVGGV